MLKTEENRKIQENSGKSGKILKNLENFAIRVYNLVKSTATYFEIGYWNRLGSRFRVNETFQILERYIVQMKPAMKQKELWY